MPISKKPGGARFDGVLKSIFRDDKPTILSRITGGVPVARWLNPELPRGRDLRVDAVLELRDGTIQQIEFQSSHDSDMGLRMAEYCPALYRVYRRDLRQTVVYVGKDKLRMPNHLNIGGMNLRFDLFDLRDLDVDAMLRTSSPGDVALAILAGGGPAHVKEIVLRAARLAKGRKRTELFGKILLLAELRGVSGRVQLETRDRMPDVIEVSPGSYLDRWAADKERRGSARVILSLLQTKFGALPDWAQDRVRQSTTAQADRWARKVLTANSLEAVIGRRTT